MAIRIKVASTAKELSDVYQLRKAVYVDGEGSFQGLEHELIVDQFDTLPQVANVIAYDDESGIAVGTMRVNCDSEIGLPCDDTFDFNPYRLQVNQQRQQAGLSPAVFIGVGMLAIAEPWRNRRDVFFALFKMSCNVVHTWDATHIIATVNAKTISIYKRLGFQVFNDEIYVPSIGEKVLPIGHAFAPVYEWASGAFSESSTLLDCFSDCFEYLLVGRDAIIFNEDEVGEEAYLISKGRVLITKSINQHEDKLSLATLKNGSLLGELSLIDREPRSATATALTNCELIVLNYTVFWQKVAQEPRYLKGLLAMLCSRLRQVDDLAFILSHGSDEMRLAFFINKIRDDAQISTKTPNVCSIKLDIDDIAAMAKVPPDIAYTYLQTLQTRNILKLTDKTIQFTGQDEI